MPVASATTSAAGSLNLLEDDDKDIRGYALSHLLSIVPQFWAEISEKISWLELLADPDANELPSEHQPYAALLLSKLYHYIGQYDEAVEFALRAGEAFEREQPGEYRETIISGCLDKAITQTEAGQQLDKSLAAIVEAVLAAGTAENGKLAIGLALSLRRIDLIETTFTNSSGPPSASSSGEVHDEGLLRYVLNEAISGANTWPISFRTQLFETLHRLFMRNPKPDWSSLTVLWVQGEMKNECAGAILDLFKADHLDEVYQICFDIFEIATQRFCARVGSILSDEGYGGDEDIPDEDPRNIVFDILSGTKSAQLALNFMAKNHRTDQSIFKASKAALEDRYSIYHSAITFSQGFANCGTANDTFMRQNLEWLARASNWAKFDVTAALGVVHKGSLKNGYRIVKPYLPGGPAPSKFSEGGALYALGLIYAGRKQLIEDKLKKGLSEDSDPIVQHGAALGLGVCAVGTYNEEIYEMLRTVLFQDNATSGEAAGYSMGLVMLGSGSNKAVDEMLSYARETQHEKIIRSLAVGTSFLYYGLQARADPLIESLTNEKDAILRYGGMFTIALAYAGTGSNAMVKRLLHSAVSDVNDDVRRAAVTALGFVLFRNYTQVPRIVQLLAESYNPHVRHGATLALGISCAGTGLEAAVELLEPMTRDPVDFVRQGAYIALAFVLIQQSEAQSPRSVAIRELFAKVVADKHEDPMARFGASLAQGIIDAGGRNATLSLSTRAGTLNTQAVVGMALFVQFWYWYPLAHGLSMAFTPTSVIAVDGNLDLPEVDFTCHAKPSQFAYPTKAKKETEKKEKKAQTAVLSTTAKAQARLKSKKAAEGEGDVDMDDKADDKPADGSGAKPETPKRQKPAEPNQFTVKNMTRVSPTQFSLLSFVPNDRYEPIRPLGEGLKDKKAAPFVCGNVVLLRDNKPQEPRTLIELNPALWKADEQVFSAPTPSAPPAANEPIAEPPAPFEYPFED